MVDRGLQSISFSFPFWSTLEGCTKYTVLAMSRGLWHRDTLHDINVNIGY